MSRHIDTILLVVIFAAFATQCAVMKVRHVAKPDASQIAIRNVQLIHIDPDDALDLVGTPMLQTGSGEGE